MDAVRSLKMWQIGVLVAVLLVGAGVTYGVFAVLGSSDDDTLAEDQQLIRVALGDLVNDVSITGSLVFPQRDELSFGTQGTAGRLLVEEGQRVVEGDPLVSLDSEAIAVLEKSVAQARVSLQDAEDALATAREPYSTLDLAQAQADVSNSKVGYEAVREAIERLLEPHPQDIAQAEAKAAHAATALADAEEALASVLEPTAQDVAQAEAKVANARTTLAGAKDALATLLEPAAQEVALGRTAVVNAEIALDGAQEALATAQGGPSEDDLAAAQLEVDSATTALANAAGDLELAIRDWDTQIEESRDALDEAYDGYESVYARWFGNELQEGDRDQDPDALLAKWGADLEALFDPDSRFWDIGRFFTTRGIPGDDPATEWREPTVYVWVNLYPGVILPTCDDGAIPDQGLCVKQELDDSWDALHSAADDLETNETEAAKALGNAEIALSRAGENLSAAQDDLDDLNAGPDALDIDSKANRLELALTDLQAAEEEQSSLTGTPDAAEVDLRTAQIALAQADLELAEAELADLLDGHTSLEAQAMGKDVEVARADLDEAEAELAELVGGPDPLALDAARKEVGVAQAVLARAEETLADRSAGADVLEVALREADVAAAEASLAAVLQRLDDAVIKAPSSGTVSAINVETGQAVDANTPIVEVVDTTVIEVEGVVDEIDVLFIRTGAAASVTMDALPGQVLGGTVSSVAAEPTTQQGVVSYPLSIQVETPPGLELPEGLSAVANVVIREDRDVLLVPLQALFGSFEQPVVKVLNGEIEEREVVLGNTDDFWAVVEDGVTEGELVVMQSQEATTAGFGFGRGFGGGFGGGGNFRAFGGGQQRR